MSLKLYDHPLSSFCHKALIALYENDTPFEPIVVNLSDEKSSAALRTLWPIAKFPVLRDETRDCTVAEATVIIEYLDAHYPGATRFIPADTDRAWRTRMWDRFYDNYVHIQMQKIVGDNLRPAGGKDAVGVEQAKAMLQKSYAMIDREMSGKTWAMGDAYSLVDCAASPALFYANTVMPFERAQRNLAAYFDRLMARPSYARTLKEAEPFFEYFPLDKKPQIARENA
ncbi:MAG TPA: glutathione S-transferase family protein [Pseudolabrys sp.]|jgi:glutathione S-transferase|nr:glutathione S-transferase family protein [Pseudolabrys sp.]